MKKEHKRNSVSRVFQTINVIGERSGFGLFWTKSE
jgi:hypothetical protein